MQQQQCLYCGNVFFPVRIWQKFCKDSCRVQHHHITMVIERPEKIDEILRTISWNHPFAVMCRKAVEYRKSIERKKKRKGRR